MLMMSLNCQKFLILMKSNLSVFKTFDGYCFLFSVLKLLIPQVVEVFFLFLQLSDGFSFYIRVCGLS